MALAQTQAVLARLYTDADLRERFFADPEAAATTLGINAEEAKQLAAISATQVHDFAQSLLRKRAGEVQKLLPLTCRALAHRFDLLFFRYAQTHVPAGTKKHYADAIAFTAFLEQVGVSNDDDFLPPHLLLWVVDIARYEAAWLKAHNAPRCCLLCRLQYHPRDITGDLPAPHESALPPLQPSLALWMRPTAKSRIWHFTFALPRHRPVEPVAQAQQITTGGTREERLDRQT